MHIKNPNKNDIMYKTASIADEYKLAETRDAKSHIFVKVKMCSVNKSKTKKIEAATRKR